MLTQARLKILFSYDEATGLLTRLVSTSSRARVGKVISKAHKTSGYLSLCVDGKDYYVHRLVWLYMTGSWPEGEVDHRDTNRSNNAWDNLRDVSRQINKQNRRRSQANSSTKVLGVSPRPNGTFVAHIGNEGRATYLGVFPTTEEASEAYLKAKRQLHAGCTI